MKLTVQLLLLTLTLLALHIMESKLHRGNTNSFNNSFQLISTENHIHSIHSQIDHIIEEHETSSDDCHGCYGNCSPLTKYKGISIICNTNLYCASQPALLITGYYTLPFRPPIIFHV
ncbi:hypothetical protein [Zooshikella sp. RANM57]|uniref:hypothetical protein n=1 Tax=Zooshikella sp. RANM57 TaxID=3425863 RepID=UPI003D7017F8